MLHTHEVEMCYRLFLGAVARMNQDMRTDPLLQHLDAFIGFARQRTGDAAIRS